MSSSDRIYAEQILASVSQPIAVLTDDLVVEAVNSAFCRAFDVSVEESEQVPLDTLGNGQWNIPDLRRLLHEVLTEKTAVCDYRVEHEFERIGKRVMLLNARRMNIEADGDRIVLAINDVTEHEKVRFELEGRKEFAEKLVDSVRESLLILHWDLRVHSANQSFYDSFGVTREETEGRLVYDLGNGQWDLPELRDLLEKILPEEDSFNDFEVDHEFERIGRRVMVLNGRRLDHLNLIILAIRDITERKEHERRQQVFMGELEHRVKNILNNVQSLAQLTRRHSTDLDQFYAAFLPRLQGLARAQELLLKTPDKTIRFLDIVHAELEAVGAEEGHTYVAEGPPVYLSPRNTQAVAMAIHELATNAGKYGALKADGGRITIDWALGEDESREFRFCWREHGAETVDAGARRGFGSMVIEQIVPHMLGGTSELSLHPDGVECRIAFALPRED